MRFAVADTTATFCASDCIGLDRQFEGDVDGVDTVLGNGGQGLYELLVIAHLTSVTASTSPARSHTVSRAARRSELWW